MVCHRISSLHNPMHSLMHWLHSRWLLSLIHLLRSRWVPSKMHRQHSRMRTVHGVRKWLHKSRNPAPARSPSEVLISQSPHQKGVNWVFHDQATGQLRYVNMPHMHSTGQQSASPLAQQPTATSAITMIQQSPNRVAQQAHQMPSAGGLTIPMSPQPAMAMNSANMALL